MRSDQKRWLRADTTSCLLIPHTKLSGRDVCITSYMTDIDYSDYFTLDDVTLD
jgi:hypothetical protein